MAARVIIIVTFGLAAIVCAAFAVDRGYYVREWTAGTILCAFVVLWGAIG